MNELSTRSIPQYVMRAFDRDADSARFPGQKPEGVKTVSTARIVLSVQYDGVFRFLSFNPVDIRGDSAEWYGYEDKIPPDESPSVLDAITQAHEYVFGDSFNKQTCREYLDVSEEGTMTRILGLSGLYTCFLVNRQYAYDASSEYGHWGFRGLSYNETAVSDLDVVEIFGFQDGKGMDYYSYFLNPDGSWLRSATVARGEAITMQHEGYLFAIGAPFRHVDRIEQRLVAPIKKSKLAIVDPRTYELVDIENAETDENGFVTFSIEEPGGYFVTAYGGDSPRNRASVSLPCLPVIVR